MDPNVFMRGDMRFAKFANMVHAKNVHEIFTSGLIFGPAKLDQNELIFMEHYVTFNVTKMVKIENMHLLYAKKCFLVEDEIWAASPVSYHTLATAGISNQFVKIMPNPVTIPEGSPRVRLHTDPFVFMVQLDDDRNMYARNQCFFLELLE